MKPNFLYFIRSILGVVLGASLLSASAHSGVVYTFTADSSYLGPTGTFTYTAPSFITTTTHVNVSDLDFCSTTAGVACPFWEEFVPNYVDGLLNYDVVKFAQGGYFYNYYFDVDVFGHFGSFETVKFGDVQHGTLTISREGSEVPEPESLALFGIALAGLGLTRRKTK